MLKTNTQSNFY